MTVACEVAQVEDARRTNVAHFFMRTFPCTRSSPLNTLRRIFHDRYRQCFVGQSGGPTSVINQTLIGVVESALAAPEIGRVFGAIHGIQGIIDGHICDFAEEDAASFETIANTPSSALLSVRLKANRELCEKIFARCQQLDVRFFFYIGGNDTAETTHIIEQMAAEKGAMICAVSIARRPSTTICALPTIALAMVQPPNGSRKPLWVITLDNRSLGGIKINIVMGRDAGWLTAASALVDRARRWSAFDLLPRS